MLNRRQPLMLLLCLSLLLIATLPHPIIAQDYILELSKFDTSFKVAHVAVSNVQHNVYATKLPDGTDALEWEIILTQQPLINTVTFPIQTKELVFYYQPPLNEEVNREAFDFVNATHAVSRLVNLTRPLQVVGSYAVYHLSKRNNEFTTGKLWHIYRPFLIDANLKTSWANLTIEQDYLTITADMKFLASAAYPIIIDPTFGKTDIGGSSTAYSADYAKGMYATNTAGSGTADSLHAYAYMNTGTDQAKMALYSDDGGGDPDELLEISSEEDVGPTTPYWYNFTLAGTTAITDDTVYHIQLNQEEYQIRMYYDTVAGQGDYKASTYPAFPDPYGTPSGTLNAQFSMYCNFTATGGQDLTFTRFDNMRLWASMTRNLATAYTATALIHLFASATMNRATLFQVADIIRLWASNTLQKALEFHPSSTLRLWASVSSSIDMAYQDLYFTLTGTLRLFAASGTAKALGFPVSALIRLWSSATPLMEGVAQDLTFTVSGVLHLLASVTTSLDVAGASLELDVGSLAGLALIIAVVAFALVILKRRQ